MLANTHTHAHTHQAHWRTVNKECRQDHGPSSEAPGCARRYGLFINTV